MCVCVEGLMLVLWVGCAEFEKAGDYKGRVVAVNAAKKPASLCGRAMDIFVAAYGSEAGVAGQSVSRHAWTCSELKGEAGTHNLMYGR